jgi:hypothetical protein
MHPFLLFRQGVLLTQDLFHVLRGSYIVQYSVTQASFAILFLLVFSFSFFYFIGIVIITHIYKDYILQAKISGFIKVPHLIENFNRH